MIVEDVVKFNVVKYVGETKPLWGNSPIYKGQIIALRGLFSQAKIDFINQNKELFDFYSSTIHENDDFSYVCWADWCRCCQ